MDFWPRIVFHTLFRFKDHIIESNYALNFIIFNIMLAVFSSSVLSQLYPSSLTVSTFSGGSASHHLWDLAFLFYSLSHSFLVLFTMLWQRHCNQHCFSWHKLGPNALVTGVRKLLPLTEARKPYLIIANSAGIPGQHSPEQVPLELHKKPCTLTLFILVTIKRIGDETKI